MGLSQSSENVDPLRLTATEFEKLINRNETERDILFAFMCNKLTGQRYAALAKIEDTLTSARFAMGAAMDESMREDLEKAIARALGAESVTITLGQQRSITPPSIVVTPPNE